MPFGNKITKEDLVAAGLDPDKLREFQEKGVTKEQLDASMNTLTTTIVDKVKAELAGLESKITARPNAGSNQDGNQGGDNNGGGNGNPQPKKTIFDIDPVEFNLDPGAHLKTVAGAIVSDNRTAVMAMRRDNAWDKCSQRLKGFANTELLKEIEEEWKNYTPEKLVASGSDPMIMLEKIHSMVMGRHFDDIQRDTDKKEGKFNLSQSASSSRDNINSNGNNGPTKKAEDQLTEAEKKSAANFGMTAQEWLDQKKEMTFVGA